MANAIEEVFPKTKHRWCLWHIMKKIPEKFQGYKNYVDIKSDIKVRVYDYSSTIDFDIGWKELLQKHDLENNEWFCNLYDERHKWVPCYLKNHFWADMSTTQRSEGMNAFFDGFINSSTTLQQFVVLFVGIAYWFSVKKMYKMSPPNIFFAVGAKNIRRKHALIRTTYSSLHQEPKMQRYKSLCKKFYDIAEAACESEYASHELEKELNCLGKKFGVTSSLRNNIISEGGQLRYDNLVTDTPSTTCGSVLVRSPVAVKRRTNRLKSSVETISRKRKTASRKNTSTTTLQPNETTTCTVIETQEVLHYSTETQEVSQLSQVAPIRFMSLLSAVHNNFDNSQC
ncbi:hypothetical protein V8G54_035989 [Vigna mungo]|uniref:Protein FAR1-RELATED SEQUENCE n=1 Tax=Vigna mungo TaxID=3915 RepID=A0AAQ3RG50_VIGMU